MTAPVRIRGEVGERRKPFNPNGSTLHTYNRRFMHATVNGDRRSNISAAARIDAIVANFKAALAELQQQHRDERARDAAEIARLRGEARLLTALVHDEAKMAAGAGAGEVASD